LIYYSKESLKKVMAANLEEIEKSIIQILIANGCLEDSQLKIYISAISESININEKPLKLMFKRINSNLNKLSLEIKTIVLKENGSNLFSYYHGIVNTTEDQISSELGSQYDITEINFFSNILVYLVDVDRMSTTDMHNMKPNTWTMLKSDKFLDSLMENKWLGRNERDNFIIIGLRSYLELRLFLEKSIKELDQPDKDEESAAKQLSALPQVILY
jgi:hypothetical protein